MWKPLAFKATNSNESRTVLLAATITMLGELSQTRYAIKYIISKYKPVETQWVLVGKQYIGNLFINV